MSRSARELLVGSLQESINVRNRVLADERLLSVAVEIGGAIVKCLNRGGKVLFFGNGGSAMDAGHLAAELMGRFYVDRAPLAAFSLSDFTAALTAIANDYTYSDVFSRQITALGAPGDVAFGLTTSGNSANVVEALAAARRSDMVTVVMTGSGGGRAALLADYSVKVPSEDTPRIQECQILIGHSICEFVESQIVTDESIAISRQ